MRAGKESKLYDIKNSCVYRYNLKILDHVNRDRGQKILDIGCGSGALTSELAYYGAEVVGIDVDRNAISEAKRKYPTVEFYYMDGNRLQFINRFDTVFSKDAFHYFSDHGSFLSGVHNALKTGGRLVAETCAAGNLCKLHDMLKRELAALNIDYDYNRYFFPTKEEYVELLERYGFAVESAELFNKQTYDKRAKEKINCVLLQFLADYIGDAAELSSVAAMLTDKAESIYANSKGWLMDGKRLSIVARKI